MADEFGDLVSRRKRFADELQDPNVLQRLLGYTRAEVGSQGDQAKLAFIESILNRGDARGQRLPQVLSGSYFPGVTHQRALQPPTEAERAAMQPLIDRALAGSNTTNYATGNASGTVGFAGGPQTAAFGGERFGVEGPDRGWYARAAGVPPAPGMSAAPVSVPTGVPGNTGLQPQPQNSLADLKSLLRREQLKKTVPDDFLQFSSPYGS